MSVKYRAKKQLTPEGREALADHLAAIAEGLRTGEVPGVYIPDDDGDDGVLGLGDIEITRPYTKVRGEGGVGFGAHGELETERWADDSWITTRLSIGVPESWLQEGYEVVPHVRIY